jgi:heme/copper-type cytochrome/quinol oxidase subunit 2
MESHPDVQLGKIFIVGCIAMMLFIIILVFVVYINARNETANCNAPTTITTKSNESQNGRTPVFFIAFIAITFLAVSTMNLTYKVNYFTKKAVESVSGPASPSPLLAMISNANGSQSQKLVVSNNNLKSSNNGNE